MTWLRTEEDVDRMIDDMVSRTKGKYITQAVAFNKTCPRQMELLKKALMASVSFSGLGKELLATKFNKSSQTPITELTMGVIRNDVKDIIEVKEQEAPVEQPKLKAVGNFL